MALFCISDIVYGDGYILYYLKEVGQAVISGIDSFCAKITNVIYLWIRNNLLSVLDLVRIFQGGSHGHGG